MRTLTNDQVRRAALGASGLTRSRPDKVDVRHFRRVMADLDVVQLDSVNVLTRAHEMPFFSRLGDHDTEALRRWLWHSREVFECWAHVASLMATDAWPLLRHRQLQNDHPWKSVQKMMDEHPGYVEAIEREIAEHGPRSLAELHDAGPRSTEHYWGWSPGKSALHWLFEAGRIAVHERTTSFAARYASADQVIPAAALQAPDVPREQAIEQLLLRAVRANSVGTAEDLADHHRLPIREARAAIPRLVARGELLEVHAQGWDRPAFTHPDLVIPRSVTTRAALVPFDPLVWFRPRLLRLWHFEYTIEIYVPAAKRRYGYYVLPFLLDDRLVARVDVKAERKTGRLLVRGAWAESDDPSTKTRNAPIARVAQELATEMQELGAWLGVPEVVVQDNGDLAPQLRRAVARG
ncbi:MAG: hypothetical protein ACI867_001065 [Glaciecola sp.]